jgi:hypothetical protein
MKGDEFGWVQSCMIGAAVACGAFLALAAYDALLAKLSKKGQGNER